MGWLYDALTHLRAGQLAHVRPLGGSMRGRIASGQRVTIVPVTDGQVAVDDAVLVQWKGSHLLHLVKAIDGQRVLIGNNLGKINGWVDRAAIIGRVSAIYPDDSVM